MDTQPVKAALGNHFEDLAFQIKGVKDMPAVVGTLEVIALLRQQHNEAENMRRMHHQEIITKLDAIEGRLDGSIEDQQAITQDAIDRLPVIILNRQLFHLRTWALSSALDGALVELE
ncbi:hypothetical protein POSPLADRAFT_1059331 [Postia placenta MAD-698-R-SB12]|uniref:Uncharacterized protein n=1 Tax=Postia placenta MAD-698-R-SB12 TaxID=670580 RepID=A0A1X6MUI6_9APHY|nr:hypothetical protein POSPLADRAFT_1059331 [Postia placenta MAD-698-R-SB12]OSX60044.1 hypothetical protein POSPLADRAFT_1059331 [Postia placenta MAD-698-R-SB12]